MGLQAPDCPLLSLLGLEGKATCPSEEQRP